MALMVGLIALLSPSGALDHLGCPAALWRWYAAPALAFGAVRASSGPALHPAAGWAHGRPQVLADALGLLPKRGAAKAPSAPAKASAFGEVVSGWSDAELRQRFSECAAPMGSRASAGGPTRRAAALGWLRRCRGPAPCRPGAEGL